MATSEKHPAIIHRRALAQLEPVVAAYVADGYEAAGCALARIRDEGLFRSAGFASFAAYVRGRWDMKDSRARQLIRAASLAGELRSAGTRVPASERQARALLPCSPGQRERVLAAVEADGGFRVVSAAQVERIAARERGRAVPARARASGRTVSLPQHLGELRRDLWRERERWVEEVGEDGAEEWMRQTISALEALLAEARAIGHRPICWHPDERMDRPRDDGLAPTLMASGDAPVVFLPEGWSDVA